MARSTLAAEAELRTYLHSEARDFMHRMVSTLLEVGPEAGECAYGQLRGHVEALADGRAVLVRRLELPPEHPQASPYGHPCDPLELGEDDVLRPIPSHSSTSI